MRRNVRRLNREVGSLNATLKDPSEKPARKSSGSRKKRTDAEAAAAGAASSAALPATAPDDAPTAAVNIQIPEAAEAAAVVATVGMVPVPLEPTAEALSAEAAAAAAAAAMISEAEANASLYAIVAAVVNDTPLPDIPHNIQLPIHIPSLDAAHTTHATTMGGGMGGMTMTAMQQHTTPGAPLMSLSAPGTAGSVPSRGSNMKKKKKGPVRKAANLSGKELSVCVCPSHLLLFSLLTCVVSTNANASSSSCLTMLARTLLCMHVCMYVQN